MISGGYNINQFIREFTINWGGIDKHSYLLDIEALKEINEFVFTNPITFFVGENGSGKSARYFCEFFTKKVHCFV